MLSIIAGVGADELTPERRSSVFDKDISHICLNGHKYTADSFGHGLIIMKIWGTTFEPLDLWTKIFEVFLHEVVNIVLRSFPANPDETLLNVP